MKEAALLPTKVTVHKARKSRVSEWALDPQSLRLSSAKSCLPQRRRVGVQLWRTCFRTRSAPQPQPAGLQACSNAAAGTLCVNSPGHPTDVLELTYS